MDTLPNDNTSVSDDDNTSVSDDDNTSVSDDDDNTSDLLDTDTPYANFDIFNVIKILEIILGNEKVFNYGLKSEWFTDPNYYYSWVYKNKKDDKKEKNTIFFSLYRFTNREYPNELVEADIFHIKNSHAPHEGLHDNWFKLERSKCPHNNNSDCDCDEKFIFTLSKLPI